VAFTGIQPYAVDPKGRVPTCPDHRDHLQGDVVCTVGWEPCVVIMTAQTFADIESRLRQQTDLLDPSIHDLIRRFVGYKTTGQLDKQGRVTLPRPHRREAQISIEEDQNQVMMVGMLDWIECWSKALFEEFSKAKWTPESLRNVARETGFASLVRPSAAEGAGAE
jgi:division/cell wall cluster transcriptional repressor MraZ